MRTGKVIGIVAVLELMIVLAGLAYNGFSVEALQSITRFSGRLSLVLFSVIFLWSDKPQKLHGVLSTQFYLIFAIAHSIHLLELVSYVFLSGTRLIPLRLLGGFAAYLLILLMPLFQYFFNTGRLKLKTFRGIGSFYLFYLWFIFFMTYLPRVMGTLPGVGGHYWEFVLLFSWVLIMMAYKAITFFRVAPARNA
jgi:hypothetical protein